MSNVYSHRNGEREAPTIDGYYWFDGEIPELNSLHPSQRRIIAEVLHGAFLSDYQMPDVNECKGRWWGPVVPPWDDAQ